MTEIIDKKTFDRLFGRVFPGNNKIDITARTSFVIAEGGKTIAKAYADKYGNDVLSFAIGRDGVTFYKIGEIHD